MLSLATAIGQTNYYSTGFESPTYTNGSLAGQDVAYVGGAGWVVAADGIANVTGATNGIIPPQGTQMLEMTRPLATNGRTTVQTFAPFGGGAKEDFQFSFQLSADELSNAAIGLSIGSSSQGASGAWAGLKRLDDMSAFAFYYRDGSSSWTQLGTNTLTLGEFYRFEMQINVSAQTFSLSVYDSSNVLQGSQSGINIYFAGTNYTEITNYNRIYNDIHQIGATKFYIDDIQVIPEPSTMLLLLLSASALALLKRRQRR